MVTVLQTPYCDQSSQSCDITVEKPLLSNWELRWMGFLPFPDGWRLRFLETPPPPYFYYNFCKKSIKRVGVEVRFVVGKALDALLLRLPPLSLWLVPIQQQIEAGMILLKVCSAASLLGEGFMNQVTSTNKASLSLLSLTMKVAVNKGKKRENCLYHFGSNNKWPISS